MTGLKNKRTCSKKALTRVLTASHARSSTLPMAQRVFNNTPS